MHIPVFIGVNGLCIAVFAVSAGCTFSVAVESMVKPAGVSPALGNSSALGTLGFVAVHIGVFHCVHLRVAVGAGGENRHRQDGHDHQNGEKRTQNFRESFCHIVIPFDLILADNKKPAVSLYAKRLVYVIFNLHDRLLSSCDR